MTILWILIELAATMFENYVTISALGRILGRRYSENTGRVVELVALVIVTGYVTLLNHFYQFEGMLSLTILLLYVVYAVIFTKGKIYRKILTTVILFSLIILINVTVTLCMSMVLGNRNTMLFTDDDGARLFAFCLAFWQD